jgi:hypothetical protein
MSVIFGVLIFLLISGFIASMLKCNQTPETDECHICNKREGRIVGYGSHSDLPFYECLICTPEKRKVKIISLEQQRKQLKNKQQNQE